MENSIDTEALKRAHPMHDTAASYGVDLRPSGRALIGRCPFHHDGGRPNFYVYPATESWYCYRCAAGGDVITFVRRMEGLDFRAAVALLDGRIAEASDRRRRPMQRPRESRSPGRTAVRNPAERACLAAAVEIYRNRALTEPTALEYLETRGITTTTIERYSVGYAHGDELAPYLRWRRLPAGAAVRAGLLRPNGREFMAGRIVVPEIRGGQPIWLVGRTIISDADTPKYLGLPRAKPLLGWEGAAGQPSLWLTEGVFDWLTLCQWGLAAVALVGTHVSTAVLQALARFQRVYLVLDSDEAGRAATAELVRNLGSRTVAVALPGVKDVADLAPLPDGRARFLEALENFERELAA